MAIVLCASNSEVWYFLHVINLLLFLSSDPLLRRAGFLQRSNAAVTMGGNDLLAMGNHEMWKVVLTLCKHTPQQLLSSPRRQSSTSVLAAVACTLPHMTQE
jgi:hypothetical protein